MTTYKTLQIQSGRVERAWTYLGQLIELGGDGRSITVNVRLSRRPFAQLGMQPVQLGELLRHPAARQGQPHGE
jgi:hypothetical protein